MRPITHYMHKDLKHRLKEFCRKRGESMTTVITRAVRKEITTPGKE